MVLAIPFFLVNCLRIAPHDGKREREIVQKLTAEAQAKQPGVNQSQQ